MLRAAMKRSAWMRTPALAACAIIACSLAWTPSALAQTHARHTSIDRVLARMNAQEARLNEQARLLELQQHQLADQGLLIEAQRKRILEMNSATALADNEMSQFRATGAPSSVSAYTQLAADEPISVNRHARLSTIDGASAAGAGNSTSATSNPAEPVGQAPPEAPHSTAAAALPEGQNALLGHGRLVIEPQVDYALNSSNRLVFRGVEIVTGIQIGLIDANDTARSTFSAALDARYALTDRLEVEARVPYVYRSDRVTTVAQNNNTVTQTFNLNGSDVGDVEFSARYQLNRPRNGGPLYIAGVRVKSDTGKGPFDLARDQNGVSTELATGSGFWAYQGSLSILYPSDPVVLYANASYTHSQERDINKTYGTVTVGRVAPGDAISGGFGFGFALNPRFSYSLGYTHTYVMPTETELNGTLQRSTELQVGSLQLGMSFRATENMTWATTVDVGVTSDAPDVRIAFRTPFSF
ncbi:MAG: hypothetical protein WAU68_16380 [Vitreimonas sp.]